VNFIEFKQLFRGYPAIAIQEIAKVAPGFSMRNLGNWQQKGYLMKIRNGWYAFADQTGDEALLFAIANHIYTPSYVSLESALSWHGLIPEGVFQITSVSSRKTQVFDSPLGRFSYQTLAPRLMLGYRMVVLGDRRFKMAEPEKALLDFLHLRPEYDRPEAVESLRINPLSIRDLDRDKLAQYMTLFANKSLVKRLKYLNHAFSG
jgi:predicted transcriptional regulator of viral defense system